eukprot:scaffold7226_cov387-Prasinococcus_capsulatus_cf.AAC.10
MHVATGGCAYRLGWMASLTILAVAVDMTTSPSPTRNSMRLPRFLVATSTCSRSSQQRFSTSVRVHRTSGRGISGARPFSANEPVRPLRPKLHCLWHTGALRHRPGTYPRSLRKVHEGGGLADVGGEAASRASGVVATVATCLTGPRVRHWLSTEHPSALESGTGLTVCRR